MASERFTILDGRVMAEEDLLDALNLSLGRPLEEVLTTLRKGSLLLKHGRHGRPKVHYFRLTQNDSLLCWRSSSGSIRGVDLRAVSSIIPGQASDVFRRYPMPSSVSCSWTLRYADGLSGAKRTLDLTAQGEAEAELWISGLRLVRSVMALPGYTPLSRRTSSLGSETVTYQQQAQSSRRRSTSDGRASTMSGPSSLPCDLLIWGSCSSSQRSSTRALWVRSAAPCPAPGNGALDAATIAVGLSHGILATRCGAVYAWGRGAGGKLGLGHDRDATVPSRVGHALARERTRAVAAGDDYSAALTSRGALYMWGRLPGGRGQPETVPRLVRGGLGARCVTQVSCGPFHCAAVTSDGELFTWGEGFGGRLGHGDVLPRPAPTRVEAFVGLRVLESACGVWHTAAIVSESARSAVAAEHNPLEASAAAAVATAAAATAAAAAGHLIIAGGSGGIDGNGTQSSSQQPSTYLGISGGGVSPLVQISAPSPTTFVSHTPTTMLNNASAPLGLPLHPPSPATNTRFHRRSISGIPTGSSAGGAGGSSSVAVESSFFHEGVGGALYTWGGVSEPVAYGDRQEKRDSNRGCLAHGDEDLYTGQLLPCRVHTPEPRSFRRVAAGAHLTVVVTTGGRVWQAGVTGAYMHGGSSSSNNALSPTSNPHYASLRSPHQGYSNRGIVGSSIGHHYSSSSSCPWEGATTLEPVRGALQGWFVDKISAGMHHVVAAGRRLDSRTGLPLEGVTAVFAWGRGAEGQLGAGSGKGGREDSAAPVVIEALRGKGAALAVAAGGATSAAVVPHDALRFEADAREEGEMTAKALLQRLDDGANGGAVAATASMFGLRPSTAPSSSSGLSSGLGFQKKTTTNSDGNPHPLPPVSSARTLHNNQGMTLSSPSAASTASTGSSWRRRPSLKLDAFGLRGNQGPATFGGFGSSRPPSIFRPSAATAGGAEEGAVVIGSARDSDGGFSTGAVSTARRPVSPSLFLTGGGSIERRPFASSSSVAVPVASHPRVVSISASPSTGSLDSLGLYVQQQHGVWDEGRPAPRRAFLHSSTHPPVPWQSARSTGSSSWGLSARERARREDVYGGGHGSAVQMNAPSEISSMGERVAEIVGNTLEHSQHATASFRRWETGDGLRLWSLEGPGSHPGESCHRLHHPSQAQDGGSNGAGANIINTISSPVTSYGSMRSGSAWRDGSSAEDRLRARVLATADAYREAALDRRRRRETKKNKNIKDGLENSIQQGGPVDGEQEDNDDAAGECVVAPTTTDNNNNKIVDRSPARPLEVDALSMLARLPAWSDAASSAPDSSELDATIGAMEAFLVRKQADLADQERRLTQWAAELRRRELELQRRSGHHHHGYQVDRTYGEGGGMRMMTSTATAVEATTSTTILSNGDHGDHHHHLRTNTANNNIASHQSVLAASIPGVNDDIIGPSMVVAQQPGATQTSAQHSRQSSLVHELSGAPSPDGRPEWGEEVDAGVTVTYTAVGGAVRVRRIRFSRTAFTKESAAAWYEAHKGELARRLAGMSAAARSAAFVESVTNISRDERQASDAQQQTDVATEDTSGQRVDEVHDGRAGNDTPMIETNPVSRSDLGRPARAHGHTLSFDVGSDYCADSGPGRGTLSPSVGSPPTSPLSPGRGRVGVQLGTTTGGGATTPAGTPLPSRLGRDNTTRTPSGQQQSIGLLGQDEDTSPHSSTQFRPDRVPRTAPSSSNVATGLLASNDTVRQQQPGSSRKQTASSSIGSMAVGKPGSLLRQLSARSAALQRQGSARSSVADGTVFGTPFSPRSPSKGGNTSPGTVARQLQSELGHADSI